MALASTGHFQQKEISDLPLSVSARAKSEKVLCS